MALLVAAALIASHAFPTTGKTLRSGVDRFHEYIARHKRQYGPNSAEYILRRQLYEKREAFIVMHNKRQERLWTAGHTSLSDRTDEELRRLRGWRRVGVAGQDAMGLGMQGTSLLAKSVDRHNATMPQAVDWSAKLKSLQMPFDQLDCGSCWAVTTAAMLSAHYEIQANHVKLFSPQQFVDCVRNPKKCGGAGGCDGATVELAMDYATEFGLGNMRSLQEYEYVAKDQRCDGDGPVTATSLAQVGSLSSSCGKLGVNLLGWSTLPKNEALPVMEHLAHGPVAVSVDASNWNVYVDGVFDSCDRDAVIDHAVLMVGYGSASIHNREVKYWKIRNSWGNLWGEDGHIRILRHNTPKEDSAFCGVDGDPKAGVACEPYPTQDTVCGMCGVLYDSVAPRLERCSSSAHQAPGHHERLLRGA